MKAAGMDAKLENTDWQIVNSWLRTLWPELEDAGQKYENMMIGYVDPGKLTGFYERRRQAIGEFLEINNQTGEEREYLLKMEQEVPKPFRYEWVEGWSQLLVL